MIRLDKLLAHSGYGSRKAVKELIRNGQVIVDQEIIIDDDKKVDENSEVIVDGLLVDYQKFSYFVLNKPEGVVSANIDKRYQTVFDIVDEQLNGLFCVGRLDIDTKGLLIITNDGSLGHKLLSPKHHVVKKYYVEYSGVMPYDYEKAFSKIILDDGYQCLPATYEPINNRSGYLSIHEGKFHQVKRMFESLGMKVTELTRVAFGPLVLDDKLRLGEYRSLTSEEVEALKKYK